MRTEDLDERYLGRDIDSDHIEIAKQVGCYVYTPRGKKYVDFVMGWCVGNFGWDNAQIKKRIHQFRGPDHIGRHQFYKPWAELAQRLEQMSPGKLKKSFRATGGTEAVEIALQAAMSFTERSKFISVEDAYHGGSIAARSIGSPAFGRGYKNPFSAHRMKPPLDSRCAEQVERALKKRDVAAVIMEPIVCHRGVLIPSEGFIEQVQAACKRHGSLLILDEVATGFWRTGKLFAAEHFKIEPDLFCLGKAMTGGFAPMGATLMTDEVAQAMKCEDIYCSTYGWHPLSAEAALATLDYIKGHDEYLEVNIREISHYILDQLSIMKFTEEPRICSKGLAIGVSFESEDYGTEVIDKAKENGLLLAEGEGGFTMFPALNIGRSTVDEGLTILSKSL
jgi:acetylornithine/succinyldiaminopimelate/putrescine aminotransferase